MTPYEEKDQQVFHAGITSLDEACKKATGKSFLEATPEQRTGLLTTIDPEAKNYHKIKKEQDATHYFTMMKQLTCWDFSPPKRCSTGIAVHYGNGKI